MSRPGPPPPPPRNHPHQLLVEGKDDRAVIGAILRHAGVRYPEAMWVPYIQVLDGVENLLRTLPTALKGSCRRFAVVLDGDEDPPARWASLRSKVLGGLPDVPLPQTPPRGGFVADVGGGPDDPHTVERIGAWLMPDNGSRGALERFLEALVPEVGAELFTYAREATGVALERGAPIVAAHREKAALHTYLAWQEPPGRPFGTALTTRALRPDGAVARELLGWLRQVFEDDERGT